ncbi:MAG: ISNCY family transposase [Candidatus Accumulibacter meliphilus]|jgi:IS5 family transposase|uniref:ISNCY family transposase n=1 Tax=Candidatus Accumulibacter meliphilus TaxID=2211374 RepID=UPI002FC2B19B
MRVVENTQMHIGEVDVSHIILDAKSRDDIPQILRGLQYLYQDPDKRAKLFQLLESDMAPKVDKRTGRPGMTLWSIFVCGVIRLDLNIDYDRLHELVNQHNTIRQMLGHGLFDPTSYHYQTLKDNVTLFTPELLNKINQIVVDAGHELVKKKTEGEVLHGRCDSFVVETDVHYPTDINLLFDATRKVIELTARLSADQGMSDWRQHAYNVKHLKRHLRSAQSTKHRKARSEAQKEANDHRLIEAYQSYLGVAQAYLDKAQETLSKTPACSGAGGVEHLAAKLEIEQFIAHAVRQIDQTRRRVILGETIPHAEKVFSIFETHTEWISKGKAGVPVELGLRVCVMEDQHRFILHHQVMERQTDEQVAVAMVKATKQHFANLEACSFDKGFHSPANQQELQAHLKLVVLPRKGKLSQQAQAAESAEDFVKARRQHSAVESAINALEVHGLDYCPDHGIYGFKRYVALAVVARNIHRIGAILRDGENRRAKRKTRYADRDMPHKMAA